MRAPEQAVRIRDRRNPGHAWFDNELFDVFGDVLEHDGLHVYVTMTRFAYDMYTVRMSLRELAVHARMSKSTVDRALDKLVLWGLVIEYQGATPKSIRTFELADVKALAGTMRPKLEQWRQQREAEAIAKRQEAPSVPLSVPQGDSYAEGESGVVSSIQAAAGTLFATEQAKIICPPVGQMGEESVSGENDADLGQLEGETVPDSMQFSENLSQPHARGIKQNQDKDKDQTPHTDGPPETNDLGELSRWVLERCGISFGRGLDTAIREQLRVWAMSLKYTLPDTAALMAERWEQYQGYVAAGRFRIQHGAMAFIGEGIWARPNAWPWKDRDHAASAAVGTRNEEPADDTGMSEKRLRAHLETISGALLKIPGLAGFAFQVRGLYDEQIGLEELDQKLVAIEQTIYASLLAELPAEHLPHLRKEATTALGEYARHMNAEQLDAVVAQAQRKILLERNKVPRLSLFYVGS